ncbi:hypothetical protein K439DRAFT_1618513 [Ramaria rubella]|nr:hypothetical protein K439DRAFT_1618513 [Ramaria rubella]
MQTPEAVELAVRMWAMPGIDPPVFSPKAFSQFLSGASDTLPDMPNASLVCIMELVLSEHQSAYTVEMLSQALNVMAKAQALEESFKFSFLKHPSYMSKMSIRDNRPCTIQTPWNPEGPWEFFITCSNMLPSTSGLTVNKAQANSLWINIVKNNIGKVAVEKFDSIWRLVDPRNTGVIDHNGFFVVLYLTELLNNNMLLPNELPKVVLDKIFTCRSTTSNGGIHDAYDLSITRKGEEIFCQLN